MALVPLGVEEHGVAAAQPPMFLAALAAVTAGFQSAEAVHHTAETTWEVPWAPGALTGLTGCEW